MAELLPHLKTLLLVQAVYFVGKINLIKFWRDIFSLSFDVFLPHDHLCAKICAAIAVDKVDWESRCVSLAM